MDAARYQELLANDGARAFPAKPYGLEPLLFFVQHQCERDKMPMA